MVSRAGRAISFLFRGDLRCMMEMGSGDLRDRGTYEIGGLDIRF